jgi:hypothetical protein
MQPMVVLDDAAVTQSSVAAGQPGDGPFGTVRAGQSVYQRPHDPLVGESPQQVGGSLGDVVPFVVEGRDQRVDGPRVTDIAEGGTNAISWELAQCGHLFGAVPYPPEA